MGHVEGGNQQIVYSQDVINPQFRSIRTPGNSDALSVCQINTVRPLSGWIGLTYLIQLCRSSIE